MGASSLVLVLVIGLIVTCDALTSSQLEQMTKALHTLHREIRSSPSIGLRFAHKCVRLAFHDCVGGCDGCLNTNNPDNFGLGETIQILERLYTAKGVVDGGSIQDLPGFGRADLWALAGRSAVEFLSMCPRAPAERVCRPQVTVQFKYGRKDCDSFYAPFTSDLRTFPSPHGDYKATTEFFAAEFDLNERETVVLMGAHTLGQGTKGISGFQGLWVPHLDTMDNMYYTHLANGSMEWTQDNNYADEPDRTPAFQWTSVKDTMMLNVDMCLLKDIVVDDKGKSACDFETCADSPGASVVREFAADERMWQQEFGVVFAKMINKVASDVALVDAPAVMAKKDIATEAEEALLVKLLINDLQKKHENN